MNERAGVFLCRCSGQIGNAVDLAALRHALEAHPQVAFVAEHNLLCSPDGLAFVSDEIRRQGGTRVVVAACSPKEHERSFQKCLERAGLNPYLVQMANIREHCTWVTPDPSQAQKKCLALIQAALARVHLHEAIQEREIEANADLLVIGGGIAGMEAALLAAQDARRQVTIVEAGPSLGGRTSEIDEVAPTLECGPCLMAPRLSAISETANIRVLTNTLVTEVVGFLGNFTATAIRRARHVDPDLCIGCEECLPACPTSVPNAFDHGLSQRKAIYLPFPGSLPNAAVIDQESCLRFRGESCTACADACPLQAVVLDQVDERIEIRAGAIVLATGADLFDPTELPQLGYGVLPDVYQLAEFERLCSPTGPTQGRIVRSTGEAPRSIAVVHCVGRRELGYCSGTCCLAALKVAPAVRHRELDCKVIHLGSDLVVPGQAGAALRAKAQAAGASFVPVADPGQVRVERNGSGLIVTYVDAGGATQALLADMVLLASGMRPNASTEHIAQLLDLERDPAGFLAADHLILRPAQSSKDGVFLAGCVSGPRSLAESIGQAHAAAGQALARIQPGRRLPIEVLGAEAAEDLCSGCLVCVAVCPYKACTRDLETGRAWVQAALCRGCGTCVAACPSGAARARHFTREQLGAEIREVLDG
jgi:heterodisulfide reductase subunit A